MKRIVVEHEIADVALFALHLGGLPSGDICLYLKADIPVDFRSSM